MDRTNPRVRIIEGIPVKVRATTSGNDGVFAGQWKVTMPGFETFVKAHFRFQVFNVVKEKIGVWLKQ